MAVSSDIGDLSQVFAAIGHVSAVWLLQSVPPQRSASEYERLTQQYRTAMAEFQSKHKNKLLLSLGVPVLGLFQAVVLISHFSAVTSLARAKVRSWVSMLSTKLQWQQLNPQITAPLLVDSLRNSF